MNRGSDKIFYADGDLASTKAVRVALDRAGATVTHFDRSSECLTSIREHGCQVLVTNVPRPEDEGLELLAQVKRIAPWLPIIMLVDPGRIDTAVEAMKAGATDCIERPPHASRLLSAVKQALRQASDRSPSKPLTEAEQAVLQLVLQGKTNGEIAAELHRSRRTVEVHRANVMAKLGADHIVDLVRNAALAGLVDV